MTDSSCAFAHWGGAYVLGALAPAERLEFERHLAGCATCAESVRRLAGLPGLLSRVPIEAVESPGPVDPLPETVLPALVAAVRREQRRRRLVTLSLGAVAAAAVIAVGTLALQSARDEGNAPLAAPSSTSPTVAPELPMTALGADGVTADVGLTSVGWGTKVDLTCTYGGRMEDYGAEEGARYSLVVRNRAGLVEQVASWQALPGKTMHIPGATATVVDDITSVEVLSASGRAVLRLDL
jgi:hypothetical protein